MAGCATAPPADDPDGVAAFKEANDPLEPLNRAIFAVNRQLDRFLLRPVAEVYRTVLPMPVRDSVRNVLNNLRSPANFANDMLQGESDRAGKSATRFAVNSTVGLGGIIDVADSNILGDDEPIPYHGEDFGQTLAVWGLGEGPYLVLPLLGPSSPRDAVGLVGDSLMDPISYIVPNEKRLAFSLARFGARGIDTRSRHIETLDEIEHTAIDFYVTIRSLYRQQRRSGIANGRDVPVMPAPEISIEFDEDIGSERFSSAEQ